MLALRRQIALACHAAQGNLREGVARDATMRRQTHSLSWHAVCD